LYAGRSSLIALGASGLRGYEVARDGLVLQV
jgi:hypothetical protein